MEPISEKIEIVTPIGSSKELYVNENHIEETIEEACESKSAPKDLMY